ncbi:MAG TPA: hypothetical protein VHX39_13120 [Acetobacteraceae bacterium]|nr:hypothetical protein [Acetobacteraceae bacterium]
MIFKKPFLIFCGAAALLISAMSQAQAGLPLPQVDDVKFKGTAGNYTATITGENFGAPPSDIPCTACSPTELQFINMNNQPHPLTANVTNWTDTAITVTGVAVASGDAVRVSVYNLVSGQVGAWGGHAGLLAAGVPRITGLTTANTGKKITVTVTGTGFGPAPDGVIGQNTNTPFFVMTTWNAKTPFTDGFPWNAGFCGTTDCNGVTIGYQSWSDTQIVLSGFGSDYAQGNWFARAHDAFCVGVWPSTSTSGGTTGATVKCKRLHK